MYIIDLSFVFIYLPLEVFGYTVYIYTYIFVCGFMFHEEVIFHDSAAMTMMMKSEV